MFSADLLRRLQPPHVIHHADINYVACSSRTKTLMKGLSTQAFPEPSAGGRDGGAEPEAWRRSPPSAWTASCLWPITLVVAPAGLLGSGLSGLASGELRATLESMSAQIRLTRTDNGFVGGIFPLPSALSWQNSPLSATEEPKAGTRPLPRGASQQPSSDSVMARGVKRARTEPGGLWFHANCC